MTSERCKVAYNYVSFSIKYPVMWGFVVWVGVGGKLEQRMQHFKQIRRHFLIVLFFILALQNAI